MCKYTQHEYDTLPHVILTSDQVWNPRSCNRTVDPEDPSFYKLDPENLILLPNNAYNIVGEYMGNQAIETPSLTLQETKDLQIQRCVHVTRSTTNTPESEALISTTNYKEDQRKETHQVVP